MGFMIDKLEIPLGGYPFEDESYTAMRATDRQAIIDLLDETKRQHGSNGYFEITMPCGYSRRFDEHADIPLEDLPCACGGTNRYLIKYQKEN